MPNGQKTPDDMVAKFRAEYLRLGNASEAARQVGIAERTGRDLAKQADADELFAEARRALYAGALDEVEALMLDCVRIAAERVRERPLTEREQAQLMDEFSLKSFSRQDIRAQYLAQIVNAHRSIQARMKYEAEKSQEPGDMNLTIFAYPPTEEAPAKQDGDAGSEVEPSSE